jgi:CheY-like chemotaxis protein
MCADKAVLYVEDEPLLRMLAAVILEDAGFKAVVVGDGYAAFEALSKNVRSFCAVVTDINLGRGPDGWAVASHARDLDPTLCVVYVTGADGHQWQSRRVPDSLLLRKPYTDAELADVLHALLGDHAS